jgi:5'-AMP-activated protein kinase, catalytic alpha subunit
MAPEIVRRLEYEGKAVDMWSLGILLYALLCGCFPFRAKTYPDLYRRIARGSFLMPEELSPSVKDVLRNLLNIDSTERLTSNATIKHVWLQMQYSSAADLNKIRRDTPILISDRPSDDIDEQVLQEMEKYGIPKDEIIRVVLTKTHTAIATLYYLLLDNVLGKRKIHGSSKPTASSSSSSSRANPHPYQHRHKLATETAAANHGIQLQANAYANPSPQILLTGAAGMPSYGTSNSNTIQRPRSASAGRTSTGRPLISFLGQR